jgi:predicted anti-sigma-YlaC factor YlaD
MKKCQDITQDIERSAFDRLTLKDKLSIRFHLSMCKTCRSYFKDSKTIDGMLKKKFTHLSQHKFSQQEKDNLKKNLRA